LLDKAVDLNTLDIREFQGNKQTKTIIANLKITSNFGSGISYIPVAAVQPWLGIRSLVRK
jgi:hypothetical protein